MKNIYLLIIIFICFHNITFAQDFQWAYQTREVSTIYPASIRSIVTDSQGNIYATGSFGGTFDFDDSQNNNILTSSTTLFDGFIIKLDKFKNFLWVKQIISNGNGVGSSVILDQNENLIITGVTSGQMIDLNPDPINQFIINNPSGNSGSFIIKLDLNGSFLNGNFYPSYFAKESSIDSNNNIITTGVVGSNSTLNNNIFVIKSNPNCNFIWEKLIQGNNIYPHSIVCDSSSNIIIRGNFMYNMTFSNVAYVSSYYSDFICKLDSNGQGLWNQILGNTVSAGTSGEDKSIKIDALNNIYFTTNYVGSFSTNFNGQNILLPTIYGSECVVFKIDTNGNHIWNVPIYGNEQQVIKSIAMNTNNELIILLYANGQTFVLNNSNQIFPTNNTSINQGGILVKLNTSGSFIDFKNIVYGGLSLFSDYENNILIGGRFSDQQDFDPSTTTQYLMSSFRGGGFVLKLGICDSNMPNGNNYQTFCSSQNPTISYLTPNSSSIKWYESATATNQLNNTTPLLNGQTYFASKQIGSCPESQRLAVTVTITQTPAAPISTNQIFCENINATISNLIATGQNIKWYSSLTDTNSLPTNTLLQNNTNYYATQTVNGCESNKTLINVTINSVPLPSVTSPQTFCVQQNAEINSIVISGQNIKWYDAVIGGNLLSNTSSLTNGQTYYASQTINNCESLRTPVSINIQNTPPPTGTTIQNFCSTQNPTLNDIVTNGTNLNWYNSNSNSSTTVIPSTTPLLNGSTYYATQTINYCESVNRLAVTVNLISTLNANDYTETICDNLNDGSEIINLSSYNTNLISNTTNCTFEYYSSNTGAINQTNTDLIPTVSNYNLTTGDHTFFVRITSSNGCHQIVKLNFSLVNKPVISINDIVPICENKNITINAGSGFNSYSWSTGSTLQSITVTTAGNYSVTVTKNYGTTICSTTKNFTVVLSNVAKITNIETQDWTDNENIITVNTSSNSYGNYEFSINGFNYQDSNVFTGLISGSYTVYVRDKNGCGVTEDEIFLLMYPKFFTPNSDGYNDTWSIKFSYIEPRLKVNIFDRYGKLLKILNNTNSWDGKYNEYELPSDDYWFIVTREDGKEYRGHFTLKR